MTLVHADHPGGIATLCCPVLRPVPRAVERVLLGCVLGVRGTQPNGQCFPDPGARGPCPLGCLPCLGWANTCRGLGRCVCSVNGSFRCARWKRLATPWMKCLADGRPRVRALSSESRSSGSCRGSDCSGCFLGLKCGQEIERIGKVVIRRTRAREGRGGGGIGKETLQPGGRSRRGKGRGGEVSVEGRIPRDAESIAGRRGSFGGGCG